MPPNDAVPQDGPTCPLSVVQMIDAIQANPHLSHGEAVAIAAVAAERARLREVYRAGHGDHAAAQFDLACAIVDGTARDATTRRA